MELLVNGPAVAFSSLGVRRYSAQVMRHLHWPAPVRTLPSTPWRSFERLHELLRPGQRNAIFWTPCQRGPLRAHHHVVTVHDCINVEYTYRTDPRLPALRWLSAEVFKGAEVLVAISHATKAAILRNYAVDESKIHVIQSGFVALDEVAACSDAGAACADAALGADEAPAGADRYVLMVTNALPHRNNLLACEAFAHSRAGRQKVMLRVVGSLSAVAREACARLGVRVVVQSDISDAELRSLYQRCLFLLSATLDEGHNLSIAEALTVGANVLCSDIPVHREFYQRHVVFFDPLDADKITAAIDEALERPGRWLEPPAQAERRSFVDVAAQYKALFMTIANRS